MEKLGQADMVHAERQGVANCKPCLVSSTVCKRIMEKLGLADMVHAERQGRGLLTVSLVLFQSTVCKRIMEKLGQADMVHAERQVVCISQDSFYRELSPQEKVRAEKGLFNFDHPGQFPSLI
uniref:Uridine kinase n=1 Tax=Timema douglasi TaxID=61478 RepID=A0A7R8VSV5_TIMDO|nr:unnamed protein product [Timema douglasi]